MPIISEAAALLGLSEYELRVYRALVAEGSASAYRLGRRSGVPLSRVYEVADRLVAKGFATSTEGRPVRYSPVPPDTVIVRARRRLNAVLDAAAADLRVAPVEPAVHPAHTPEADWIGWEADKHTRLLHATHSAWTARPA